MANEVNAENPYMGANVNAPEQKPIKDAYIVALIVALSDAEIG